MNTPHFAAVLSYGLFFTIFSTPALSAVTLFALSALLSQQNFSIGSIENIIMT